MILFSAIKIRKSYLAKGVKQDVDFILTCAFGSSEILLTT